MPANAPQNGQRTTTRRSTATKSSAQDVAGAADLTRRTEILMTANTVIASSGLRTSLQQIADAAGILAGSLYHHFESKEAILVELIRRYHADLDRIGDLALGRLDEPGPNPASEQIIGLGCAIARCGIRLLCRCRSTRVRVPTRS
jgi:AcrR family transcriptional regulator